jgi:hypothetical protein
VSPLLDLFGLRALCRWERWSWGALALFVVLSRLLVAPALLYDWDAANYALAVERFDIYEHQPHAPGMPLFVLLLRILSVLPVGAVWPFLIVNSVFGVGTLLLMGAMLRPKVGPRWAWLVAAAYALCPIFWHHAAASTAYVTEGFASTLVAASALALAERRLGFVAAGLLFATAAALRPNVLLTLSPLALWGVVSARASRRELVRYAAAAALGVALFALPTVLGTGWERYQQASGALFGWTLSTGSVLSGDLSHLGARLSDLTMYLFDGANVLVLLLLVNLLRAVFVRRFDGRLALFLLTWVAPAFVLYVAHHLPKSGYALTLLPAVFIAAGWSFGQQERTSEHRRLWAVAIVGLYALINGLFFFVALSPDAALAARSRRPLLADDPLVLTSDYGAHSLRQRTKALSDTLEVLDLLAAEDVAVFTFGTHELYRLGYYYRRDKRLAATSLAHRAVLVPWASSLPGRRGLRQVATFGDYQRITLRKPSGTASGPVRVSYRQGRLTIARRGRAVTVPLGEAKTAAVFLHCAPCGVLQGPGVQRAARRVIGAHHRAIIFRLLRPGHEGHQY